MKKRFMSMLLVLCMVFTMFPSTAFAEDTGIAPPIAIGTSGVEDDTPLCENHKAHTVDCGYAEAVEGADCTHVCELCKGAAPALLAATPRTAITGVGYSYDPDTMTLIVSENGGTTAWRDNPNITKADVTTVDIGSSVTTIGNSAFSNCTKLDSVTFAEGSQLTTINQGAFSGCQSLASVTIPEGVTTINNYAFKGCTELASVTFEGTSKLATIVSNAFYGCASLASVAIPEGVTTIGSQAFADCTILASVTFEGATPPTTFETHVFYGTASGLKIYVPKDSVQAYKSVSNLAAYASKIVAKSDADTGYSYDPDTTTLTISSDAATTAWRDNPNITQADVTTVVMESGVTAIGDSAFYGCTSLASVTIPEGVTTIGKHAFNGCTSLASVTIPENVANIGESAFNGCSSLASAIFKRANPPTFGEDVFKGTLPNTETSMFKIYVPTESVAAAYKAVSNLADFQLQIAATSGNGYSYDPTTKTLTVSTTGGTTAWATNQSRLDPRDVAKVFVAKDVGAIGALAFDECKILTNVTFEEGSKLTTIGEQAFYGCSGLTSLTIPSKVTTMGMRAFAACNGLTNVTFSNGVTTIGVQSFHSCTSLTSVNIPNSVTTIKSAAFYGCSGLTKATFEGETPPASYVTGVFNSTAAKFKIHVPSGTEELYKVALGADGDKVLMPAIEGDGFRYESASGTLTISKNEGIASWKASGSGLAKEDIINVVMTGVTKIDNEAFYDCTNLASVDIPSSVTSIGQSAFIDCKSLESVTIPSDVTTIDAMAFYNCNKLASVTFEGATPPTTFGGGVFTNTADTLKIYVPSAAAVTDYQNVTNLAPWKKRIVAKGEPITGEIVINNGGVLGGDTSAENPSIIFGDYIMPRIVTAPPSDAQLRYQWKVDGVAHDSLHESVEAAQMCAPKESVGKAITLEISDAGGKYASMTATSNGNVAKRDLALAVKINGKESETVKYGANVALSELKSSLYYDDTLSYFAGISSGSPNMDSVGTYTYTRNTTDAGAVDVDKYYNTTFTPSTLIVEQAAVDFSIALSQTSQKINQPVTITVTAKNKDVALSGDSAKQVAKPTLTGPGGTLTLTAAKHPSGVGNKPGVWTATYTTPSAIPVGGKVTFTATYTDATGNYIDPANKTLTADLTITDKSAVIVILAADKSSPTYGDSVTLTAEVQKANSGDPGTVAGTVQFKVDGNNIGDAQTLRDGMISLTVDKTILQAAAGGKEYAFTAEFTSTDEDIADGTSGEATVTVAQKPLNVSISCAGKVWDGNTTAAVTYSVSGVVSGDTVTASGTSALYDSADVGTGKTVTATGITLSGADVGNYSYNTTATTTATISKVAGPAAPTIAIDYDAETVNTATTWEYKVGSGAWTDCTANMNVTDFGWNGTAAVSVIFRVKETATHEAGTESAALAIPARPATPLASVFTITKPTSAGASDGKLAGITSDMEYKKTGDAAYTNGTGAEITSIADGTTYLIRSKVITNVCFASGTVSVTVASKQTATITFADGTAAYNGSAQLHETATTSEPGGTMTYTYTAEAGSSLNAQGKPQDVGSYTVTAAYESDTHTGSKTVNFTITPAMLIITGYTVTDKTYDGTDTATISNVTFGGLQNGETLAKDTDYAITEAKFAQKNAADASIAVNGKLALASNDKTSNYSLPSNTLPEKLAKINKAALTGGTIDASQSKPYDATNSFTGVTATYTGGVNSETVTGKVSGTVTGVNANVNQALTVTGQTLDTAYATNYTLPANNAVTGNVAIAKINPEIRIDAPSTVMAGKDVTVTVKITKPTGAAAGFPAADEITLVPNGDATLKTALAAVSGKPGEYAATYTIWSYVGTGNEITFTATIPTATTNYNADSTGVTKSLTVSDKYGTQTTLIADKASVTYGESVILTATVTKANLNDPGTPTGTVSFHTSGSLAIGTPQPLVNGKATLTLNKSDLPVGPLHIKAVFNPDLDNDFAYSESSTVRVAVAQKPLTIRAKNQFTYQNKTTLPTPVLEYDGLVDGETVTGYTAAHSVSDTKTFGTFAINVTGSTANTNYAVTTQNGLLTIHEDTNTKAPPATELPNTPADKPIVVAEPSDPAKQLRVITAALAEEEAEPAANWLLTQPEVKPDDLMESHEVELQVSTDGGATWQKATMADVKAGKVKVALPIPAGTDPTTHSYTIYHFANGADSPANESFTAPDYNASSKTLSATVTSLSPFVVVATPKGGGNNDHTGGSSSDDSEYDFWMAVKKNLQKADSGDVIKVNARGYDKMPWSVMDALRENSGVSMVITWSGKTITIPAGKAQKNEPGRIYWPLSKLAELYADIAMDTVLSPTNPETGGPGKYIPATGGADVVYVPVSGGSTITANAPEIQREPKVPVTIRERAVTQPDAGFEADAYAGTPDAKGAGTMNAVAFAGFAVLLAALCGGGVWFWKRRRQGEN